MESRQSTDFTLSNITSASAPDPWHCAWQPFKQTSARFAQPFRPNSLLETPTMFSTFYYFLIWPSKA